MCWASIFSVVVVPVAARQFAKESSKLARGNCVSTRGANNDFATVVTRRKMLPNWHLERREFSPAHRQLLRVKTPRMIRRAAAPRDCFGLLESGLGRRYPSVLSPTLSESLP